MKQFLVTGGAGFIGSHIAAALLSTGSKVRILDNFSTGKLENLHCLPNQHLLSLIEGDVCESAVVDRAMQDVDAVFHQAALVSVPVSLVNPRSSFLNNAMGSFNVFDSARKAGVGKIVFASSAAVYGNSESIPLAEDVTLAPLTPYALDKEYMERLADVYWHSYGLQSVGLRYFNVYGLRQSADSPYSGVISLFSRHIRKGEGPTIFGDGNQSRDFVFVDDVVAANLSAMLYPEAGARIFNVGSGKETTINELWNTVSSLAGGAMEPAYAPFKEGDIYRSVADISLIGEELGWRATVSLHDGLRKLLGKAD